jgi:16S rRNA (cytosine1402-N4)-methyltransferase
MELQEEKQHKRRVRYKGTHPKSYNEKYKELQPEKYVDTVEHVIRKGSTPAGMHISILVNEIIEFLQIKPGQKGLDATLGYGGHTSKMLECLQGEGHMYGLDIDPIEIEKFSSSPFTEILVNLFFLMLFLIFDK